MIAARALARSPALQASDFALFLSLRNLPAIHGANSPPPTRRARPGPASARARAHTPAPRPALVNARAAAAVGRRFFGAFPPPRRLAHGAAADWEHEALRRWQAEVEAAGGDHDRLAEVRGRLLQAVRDGSEGRGPALLLGNMATDGVGGAKDKALAESCFLPAAEAGDVYAMYCLAHVYLELGGDTEDDSALKAQVDSLIGRGAGAGGAGAGEAVDEALAASVRKGIQQLIKSVRHAKQNGKPIAFLAKKRSGGEGGEGGRADGERWLRASAEGGFAYAQVLLGNLLVTGRLSKDEPVRLQKPTRGAPSLVDVEPVPGTSPVEQRRREAEGLAWFEKAAEGGQADAWYNLALIYFEGSIVPADTQKGMECVQKAAELGDSDALYLLGTHRIEDPATQEEGRKMLVEAADKGHALASYFVAMLLLQEGDTDGMRPRLERAAALGCAEANFCLGDMHYHGTDGYEVHYPRSLLFFAAAARARHSEALCSLGAMLYNGLGTKKDLYKAFSAYQLAAEMGSIPAMRNLASMHANGEACERDENKAKYLLGVAQKAEDELQAAA